MAAAAAAAADGSARRRRRRGRSRGWSKSPRRPRPAPSASPGTGTDPSPPARDRPQPQPEPLPPGAEVEVRVDDDGFHGSWYEATVVDFAPARGRRSPARYTVTYAHLLADHDGSVLAELFAPSHIRPRPPPSPSPPPRLRPDDIVEAFHKDGWWSGIVVAAPSTSPSPGPDATAAWVTVAFPITREVIRFPPRLVRPRRDYVDGAWVPSRVAMVVRPSRVLRVYEVGDKVEVGRDRDGYGYSWFPATVARVVDDLSYVVEYFDLEEEGEGGPEKATEYLHWRFIRPAVEHLPRESEFQLGPGAAVEVYCDGAWSPGVVRSVVGEGEFEISIAGKKSELLVTQVVELLKPQYKWNGKQWRIATVKRRANLRRRSISGKSPNSPVDLTSSGEEHCHGPDSSATKRSTKKLKQLDTTLAEGSGHASVCEMVDTPSSALCKSPESTRSPNSSLAEKNSPQVVSHGIVNSVPNIDLLCASSGHLTPVDNLETVSDMVVYDGQLSGPISGTSVDDHDMLSIAELRRKMASARRDSAVQQTQKRLVKSLRVKKCISKIKVGKTNPIQERQGKVGPSNNIQLTGNMNFSSQDIVCALGVSVEGQATLSPEKRVSIRTRRGSSTKVLACKKLASKRGSKELCSPNSTLDVTSTVQQRGRKKMAESIKEWPLAVGSPESDTQEQLVRTLEYAQNITESMYNGKGNGIHDSQPEEGPAVTTNGFIQPEGNDDMCTDHVATEVPKSTHVMETAGGKVDERSVSPRLQNAGSSQCTMNSSTLRSCSASESLLPSSMAPSQISNHQDVFVKSSAMWSLIDAMGVLKELPQQPHFLPLLDFSPALREGMALGLMVSFVDIVKSAREVSIDNSMEWFEDKISTLCHLEANGFSVQSIQSTLTELFQIKSTRASCLGEIDKLKKKIVGKTTSSRQTDALLVEKDRAIAELEQKLGRLRQESQKIAMEKENEEAELLTLKMAHSKFEEAYGNAEQEFGKVLARLHRRQIT